MKCFGGVCGVVQVLSFGIVEVDGVGINDFVGIFFWFVVNDSSINILLVIIVFCFL